MRGDAYSQWRRDSVAQFIIEGGVSGRGASRCRGSPNEKVLKERLKGLLAS